MGTFPKRKQMSKQPDIPRPKTTIRPGNDFYMYMNANWLRHASIPSYKSSYGVSEEIEDEIQAELESLLMSARHAVRTKPHADLSIPTQLVGTLAESILHVQSQPENIKFVKKLLRNLHCMRTPEDVGHAIGEFLRYRIGTCMSVFTSPSESDSKTNFLCFSTGNLGLQDPAYYTGKEKHKLYTLQAYGNLLKRLQDDFEVDTLQDYVHIEQEAAAALVKSRNDDEWKTTGAGLKKEYPHIPWEALAQTLFQTLPQATKFLTTEFLILSTTWMEYLNKCFQTYSVDAWRVWLSGNILIHVLPLLPPPYDDIHYTLYGKRLRGQAEKVPQKQLALQMAEQWAAGPLGELYIRSFVSKDLKEHALKLAKEIQHSAAARLGSLEWMEPSTRAEAKRKIESIFLGVAYPEKLKKRNTFYKSVELFPTTFVQNIFTLGAAEFEDDVRHTGRALEFEEWDDPVFAVNAYYYNEGNRLILPSGILRFPFFDVRASDGWNYGGLGAAIGHEMTHAFDVDGKDYDHKGNKRDWWTAKDEKEYKLRTKALEKLYADTTYFGQPLDGTLTLSENIADLGGLAIALGALKHVLDKKGIQGKERTDQLCEFFQSFAVSWRTKEKREKALQSLFMDVHAPPPARVNNIVCQFDDWYECFDVKPGDTLYKDPKERIRIF